MSFGGTKNGLLGAEAVVFLAPELADGISYLRKQSMQLASKMRYLAAQFEALLPTSCGAAAPPTPTPWPSGSNEAVGGHPGLPSRGRYRPTPCSRSSRGGDRGLQRAFTSSWDERTGEVRWMCSWDTTEDVDEFAAAIAAALARGGR